MGLIKKLKSVLHFNQPQSSQCISFLHLPDILFVIGKKYYIIKITSEFSSSHVLDYQFLLKNEDYEKLIAKVDVGNHNWLDFSISDKDKLDLFIRGIQAASKFLTTFNWEKYKDIRAGLIRKNENK